MNGAQAVLESLKKEGVDIVFGYPGGAVLTLYDAVYQMKFPHVLTRHEQGAVAIPVMRLPAPGPDVAKTTPTLPVARA